MIACPVVLPGELDMFRCVMGAVIIAWAMFPAAARAGATDGLMAADRSFSALSVAKGSNAAYLAVIATNARLFGNGSQPPIFGKVAAGKRFAAIASTRHSVLSWVPEHASVSADGTLGYTDGTWLFTSTLKGRHLEFRGHYLRVWRRVAGHWKVLADMGTTDP